MARWVWTAPVSGTEYRQQWKPTKEKKTAFSFLKIPIKRFTHCFYLVIRRTYKYLFITSCWGEIIHWGTGSLICAIKIYNEHVIYREQFSVFRFTWIPMIYFRIWRCDATAFESLVLVQTSIIGKKTFFFRINGHSLALWYTHANCNLHFICLKHISHHGRILYHCCKRKTSSFHHIPF